MDAAIRAALPGTVCGKRFYPRSLRIIREIIAGDPQLTRKEISRRVCDRLDWHDLQGKRKEMGAAVALQKFDQKGWIQLPPRRKCGRVSGITQAVLPDDFEVPDYSIECSVHQLGKIDLEPVSTVADSRLWNGLISTYHYQGYTPLCGAQIRYLIRSTSEVLGAISFSAAAMALRDRDSWIGWDRLQRQRNRHLIVNNSRFLILPWVKVKNLASHVLAKAARQLPGDFQQRYGYSPMLLETFVEQARFQGTCYKAANWICAGQTSGRGRSDYRSRRQQQQEPPPLPIKSIWLYPLTTRARQRLCTPAQVAA